MRTILRLVRLEDRAVPATQIVNSLSDVYADDDEWTLREAIGAANNSAEDTTIIFRHTSGPLEGLPLTGGIDILSALPALNKNVTIDGQQLITISRSEAMAGTKYRIFTVNSGVTATLKGLSMWNGNVDEDGGGIHNSGTLTLDQCSIWQCKAGNHGGGIYNADDASLKIKNSSINENQAGKDGGGVYSSGGANLGIGADTVGIEGSTIGVNTAGRNGGGLFIHISLTQSVHLKNNTILGNDATGSDPDGGDGGGIFLTGSSGLTCTIEGGEIRDNHAQRNGGGIWNGLVTTVKDVHIKDNRAESKGGGVYGAGTNLTLDAATRFTANLVTMGGSGNAIYFAAGGTLTNNAIMDEQQDVVHE